MMAGVFFQPQVTSVSMFRIVSLYITRQGPSRLMGGASSVLILGLPKTRRVFLWLSYEKKAPVCFLGKGME